MKNVLLSFLVILLSACNIISDSQALSYHEKIVFMFQRVSDESNRMIKSLEEHDSVAMTRNYNSFLVLIDSSISVVDGLEDFDGDTGYREASLNYLNFFKDVSIKNLPLEIAAYSKKEMTDEDNLMMDKIRNEWKNSEHVLWDELSKSMNLFARKHKFKLEENL